MVEYQSDGGVQGVFLTVLHPTYIEGLPSLGNIPGRNRIIVTHDSLRTARLTRVAVDPSGV